MVRLSKLTDYGLVLMSRLAQKRNPSYRTARDLSLELQLPLPTVSKLLKALLQNGLLVSHRGIHGGYSLARQPQEIGLAEIITALEGPIALTECSTDVTGLCQLETCCTIRQNQQVISQAVRGVLEKLTLSDLIQPLMLTAVRDSRGNFLPAVGLSSGRMQ